MAVKASSVEVEGLGWVEVGEGWWLKRSEKSGMRKEKEDGRLASPLPLYASAGRAGPA